MKLKRNVAVMIITCALCSVAVASCNPVEVEQEPRGRNGGPSYPPIAPESNWSFVDLIDRVLCKEEEVNNSEGQ
ncbi:hypothetical protein N473_07105 [Pseudoalteromonas luteoviolacea CPMOR-1]|uniref:Lipoprotein n=1 Tax=Pseudoalteromonas luteoviolacea CPMOR-1 TaxID=1365248 RepID=A0A167H4X4_9GAMM|nr:hypothetical protein [Pseudoalteromonas luteoviolacea]KZN57637.1 hypothetical protein N473_07105 [Pseudoalteromonas luteoviolacea CPMOR-1]